MMKTVNVAPKDAANATATNADTFTPPAIAPSGWRLPQFALAPREGQALRSKDGAGQERVTFVGHGDINMDARGELVVSVQATLVHGDALREALVRPLLQSEVELDARVHLDQVIDCLIETTSLGNGAPDPRFRALHGSVTDQLRGLLAKLEQFAFPELACAA